MTMRSMLLATLAAMLVGSLAQPARAQSSTEPMATAPETQATYSYEPAGRRDPFRSLLAGGVDRPAPALRPDGLRGMLIDETSVKGILRSGTTLVAMIAGADGRTFTARVGDPLLDGSVKQITSTRVVFTQDVDDPLSTVKEREVTRFLRSPEDVR